MTTSSTPHFDIHVARSVAEIAPANWDALSEAAPFQSHRWYRFGEAVMAGCQPVYLNLLDDGQPLARASLWRVQDEPLQIGFAPARNLIRGYLHRRPLMICRSPLSTMPGLLTARAATRGGAPLARPASALRALVTAATEQARRAGASFLVFDFLTPELGDLANLGLKRAEISGPGTVLKLAWCSFDEFVAGLSKNERKHYRRSMRRAQELGITVTRHQQVSRIPEALALIRNMERRFGSAPNPWMAGMMEHLDMVAGTWLAATIGDRLVGCELVLQDNGAQVVTALGLADDVPYAYFALGYEDIRIAIESGMHTLYWGSGAYHVKERLGFSLYPNNLVAFAGLGAVPRLMGRIASTVS